MPRLRVRPITHAERTEWARARMMDATEKFLAAPEHERALREAALRSATDEYKAFAAVSTARDLARARQSGADTIKRGAGRRRSA